MSMRIRLSYLIVLLMLPLCVMQAAWENRPAAAFPQVWHKPDTAVAFPSFVDTVGVPMQYTMMYVYRSLQPDVPQTLWAVTADSLCRAVSTHGAVSRGGNMQGRKPRRDISVPVIFTYSQSLKPDTSYHGAYRLCTGSDQPADTSRVVLYEAAWFNRRLNRTQSLLFQTYLALRHGITLDRAHYLSTAGDTLWHALSDKEHYHHVQGIGTDTVYGLSPTRSLSQGDSTLILCSRNPLPCNTYVLMGDDNAACTWMPYDADHDLMQRTWKAKTTGDVSNTISVRLNGILSDEYGSGQRPVLAVLNSDRRIAGCIEADSVGQDGGLYFPLPAAKGGEVMFSFARLRNMPDPSQRKARMQVAGSSANEEPDDEGRGGSSLSLTPNPTSGAYRLDISLPRPATFRITVQDAAGRVVSTSTCAGSSSCQHTRQLSVSGVYLVTVHADGEQLGSEYLLVK